MLFRIPVLLLLLVSVATSLSLRRRQTATQYGKCRFSPGFTPEQISSSSLDFEQNVFFWDGQFHQDGVGYQRSNGVTIDHILLGYTTGIAIQPPVLSSSPRNEAYHIMLLTHAIAGNTLAAIFVNSTNPVAAAEQAFALLNTKLTTYLQFNHTYPGYGGFLPSYESNATAIWPAQGWTSRLSAEDNGFFAWSIYGLIQALGTSSERDFQQLAVSWATYFIYLRTNAKGIFYNGTPPGSVCAISTLKPGTYPYASFQSYTCDQSAGLLNDPYSGELMTWILYFSGSLNTTEAKALWDVKRPQLQAVNYTGSIVDTSRIHSGPINYAGKAIKGRHIVPITTQKGRYFGSQEHLKLLVLPYLDIAIVQRVMKNAERIRTCNSWLMDKTPGLFAAVPHVTSPDAIDNISNIGYISDAGIPSVSTNQTQEQDVLTPYAAFPVILIDKHVGLLWYKTLLDAKGMQSVYGSVAGIRRDGSAVSRIVSWETKAPILLALLGGITGFVRDGLKKDQGVWQGFVNVTSNEYSLVFDELRNGGRKLMGEDVPLCLPNQRVSGLGILDYSSCRS